MALLTRASAFAVILAIYLAAGWLNFEQAGRIGLLGLASILAVSAWTARDGSETRIGKVCGLVVALIFLVFMSYHGFLREHFGMSADEGTVAAAIFSSDRSETGEFLEHHYREVLKHSVVVLVFTLLFALILWRWPRPRPLEVPGPSARRKWITVGACLAFFLVVHLNSSMRKTNPLLFFPSRYAQWKHEVAQVAALQSKMNRAASNPDLDSLRCIDDAPRTVVFLLSESITRLNLPYVGYARNTAPELTALGAELTWFSDVLACDGSTVPAICKILTPSTIAQPNLWLSEPDLFIMARKVGYKTFWLSNHTTDANGEVSVFASHADRVVLANRGSSRGEGSLDEVLLPLLQEALKDPSPRKFIVLHLLGAHPAYYYRYPKAFAKFNGADDAVTRGLKAAGRAFWAVAMRNYYDNALLYSDHVVKQSLELCRESGQRVAWLFAPDHGHDAAHYSNFSGHNSRAPSQYEIPMIFWRSETFPAPAVPGSALAERPYQTDVLDHTLLGLMSITGKYYEPRNDILSPEFQPLPRSVRGQAWVPRKQGR